MKQKGKNLIALFAVVLLLSIAAVALVACNGDGNLPSAPTDPQAPDGHTHIAENFTQVDAPTCTEPGTEGATCTECGEYFTRAIAPLGHDFDWTLTELDGDLGDEVLTGTIHLTCKRNPNEIYDIEGTAVRTQYSAPTCDAEGFATYNAKGSLDGYEYDVTDTFKLAPHHDWVMGYEMVDGKPEVTLTCSRDGSHIYKTQGEIVSESIVQEGTCSVSGRKSIVISATDEDGHVYQKEDEIDYFAPHSLQGACHLEGEDLWELNVCSNCDYKSDKPLPKTLKEEQIYPCTDERKSFRTYDYYSEDWETTFEETFYYKDHKFTEWGFAQEPTCKDGGIKAPKCSVCGALSDENREPVQPSPEYHRFETVYDIDAHWEECSVCQEERGNHIAHAYDTVGECDCGRELFEFELNQTDTYTLKKFNCGVNEVVVPAQYKGVDVTEIGAYAFGVKNDETSDIDDSDRSNRLGNIESIILPESITTINEHAFSGCGMTTFNIPASVVKIEGDIDNNVFENCSNLKSISVDPNNAAFCSYDGILYNKADDIDIYHVPQAIEGDVDILNGCWMIGNNAFANRTGMTSVNIPSSVQSIGWFSFDGCTGLKTVNIEEGLDSIGGGAFVRCDSLTSFIIPNSVTIFYGSAFTRCENLETLTIGEGVTTIEDGEMAECNSFTTVNWNAINCLHAGDSVSPTFAQCPKFDTVNIGEKVQTIPNYVFKNCTHLQTVNWNATNCTDVGSEWISGCAQFATVNIDEKVQTIPNSAFSGCIGLQTVNWNATNCTEAGSSSLPIFSGCTQLATLNIGENVQSIPSYAFYDFTGLQMVMICEGVTSIGAYAFENCTGLKEITIPDSVTSIGDYAFEYCSSLTTVNWNATNCTDASSEGVFPVCTKLATVNIGENVQTIPARAFYNCTGITTITIPNSVISIGADAFYGCTGLNEITIGEGVTSIGDYAFSCCKGLQTVNWNATNCTEAGSYSLTIFSGTQLVTLNIGENVRNIPNRAFENCSGLQTITIPDSVISIGDYAFDGCTGLQTVTIGKGVQSIGQDAFAGCIYITTATYPASAISYIPQGNLTTVTITIGEIGESAFEYRSGLQTITIGEGVTSIGSYAFYGCTSITKVNYLGTLKGWCEIDYGSNNPLCVANYNKVSTAKLYVKDVLVTEVKELDGLNEIPEYAFCGLTDITSVTIPDSVTSIGSFAFYNCEGITKVNITSLKTWCEIEFGDNPLNGTAKLYVEENGVAKEVKGNVEIPAGTTNIGNSAFYGLTGITSVTIPDSVTSIGTWPFSDCTGLKSFVVDTNNPTYQSKDGVLYYKEDKSIYLVPLALEGAVEILDGCTSIPSYIFSHRTKLQEVTISAGVTSIGEIPFYNCTGLQTVNWNAANCTEAGSWSSQIFNGCTEFTTLNIGENVQSIPSYAFKDCTGLQTITIPDSVTRIGNYAFYACAGLQTVTIGKGVQSIGDQAFASCTSLMTANWNATNCTEVVSSPWTIFSGCTQLVTLNIGENVQSIPGNAFRGCTGLTSIILPSNVTSIGDDAFRGCTGLQTVTIGEGVTSIGNYAFYGCTGITSVIIPESVQSIGDYAFYGCEGLQTVYYEGTSEQWNDISIEEYQNSSFINAKRYYFSGQDPYQNGTAVEDEEYWHWNEEHTAPEVWVKQD